MQPLPPSPIKLLDVEKVLEVRDVVSVEKVVVHEAEEVVKVVEEVSEKVTKLVDEVKTSSCWAPSWSSWWSRFRSLPAKPKVLSKEPPAE